MLSILLSLTVTRRRHDFLESIPENSGRTYKVQRTNVFDDVVNLYRREAASILGETPLQVEYKGERAMDTGGVLRDVFSAFWEDAIPKLFDGGSAVIPAITPHSEMVVFSIIGTVLSHGFLEAGFLPVRVAFPIIACTIKGPLEEIPNDLLLASFIEYLSSYEADIVRKGLKASQFSAPLMDALLSLLSRFHCRKSPSPNNVKALLIDVARHEMMTVPMKVLHYLHAGVPVAHRKFWDGFSVLELYDLICSINATPGQILTSLLCNLEELNPAQARVFNFLLMFIGNMKTSEEVQRFLRFVTGSSVSVGKGISVTFNSLEGAARRPIAHTCSCELELSQNYSSSIEFATELKQILSNDLSWIMDAI